MPDWRRHAHVVKQGAGDHCDRMIRGCVWRTSCMGSSVLPCQLSARRCASRRRRSTAMWPWAAALQRARNPLGGGVATGVTWLHT